MGKRQSGYLAYMVRLWQAKQGMPCGADVPVWRASIEDAHTGARRGFVGLDALFDYLRRQASAASNLTAKAQREEE